MTNELRDRIARALHEDAWPRVAWDECHDSIRSHWRAKADAVLGVLSEDGAAATQSTDPTDGWEQVGWRHAERGDLIIYEADAAMMAGYGWEPVFRRVDGATPHPDVALWRERAIYAEAQCEEMRGRLNVAPPAALAALVREFVDEAVNGDHFCGGVPTEWTDRLSAVLGDGAASQPEPYTNAEGWTRTDSEIGPWSTAAPPDGEVERRDRDMDRQDIIAQERMIRALNGEVEHLRTALAKYGRHIAGQCTGTITHRCTCGLIAALSDVVEGSEWGSGAP
jgi:hypothetical protein